MPKIEPPLSLQVREAEVLLKNIQKLKVPPLEDSDEIVNSSEDNSEFTQNERNDFQNVFKRIEQDRRQMEESRSRTSKM